MTNDEWKHYKEEAGPDASRMGTITELYGDTELIIDWDYGASGYFHDYLSLEPNLFVVQIGETSNVDEAIELATKAAQLLGLPAKVTHV